ncbi:MAG TPA: carboxypeptidase-like regulatory domain-containing protein [Gemmatimonadaceae bacterium]|nr:carboxypeptidase-like regulatory domain-containing protein [Gemmatimonadaceae bacterium]
MLPHRPAAIFATAAIAALLASPLEKCEAQQSDSSGSLVTVSGTVYDSLSGRPLEGALVQLTTSDLRGRVLRDTTNLLGSFSISDVKAGEYLIGFTHR